MRLVLLLLLPAMSFAGNLEKKLEILIAQEWLPDFVRIKWTGKVPISDLASGSEIFIDSPKPTRFAGSLNLKLASVVNSDTIRINVSGFAKVYGGCLTVIDFTSKETILSNDILESAELEWTRLGGRPLTNLDFPEQWITAHSLIPGRPVFQKDIKPLRIVTRGNNVLAEFNQENIKITFDARALKDGGIGEEIPIKLLTNGRCFKGVVTGHNHLKISNL